MTHKYQTVSEYIEEHYPGLYVPTTAYMKKIYVKPSPQRPRQPVADAFEFWLSRKRAVAWNAGQQQRAADDEAWGASDTRSNPHQMKLVYLGLKAKLPMGDGRFAESVDFIRVLNAYTILVPRDARDERTEEFLRWFQVELYAAWADGADAENQ